MDDPSLQARAAHMACDAMGELSKGHFIFNRQQHAYTFAEPPCELAFGFADRDLEYLLQRGMGMSKNQCMFKTDVYGRGPWVAQHKDKATVSYDQWTRGRSTALCGDAAKAAILAQECCPTDLANTCFI